MSISKEQENIIDVERKNILMLILYRSLYILKKKFEIYKPQINQIYQENKEPFSNLLVLPINKIPQILKNITLISQFYIIPYNRYSELFTIDLLNNRNKKQTEIIINYIYNYIKEHISEYNSVFYEKKSKEIEMKKELENKNEEEEISIKLNLYNRRGKIIKTTEEINEQNKLFELEGPLYQISEEDIQILNSDKFLYSETIPLIIADYLQQNSNIVIIPSNEELNEEIKTLFDSEILKKISFLEKNDPNEEQNGKIKNLLFEEMNINQKIQLYENLVIEKNQTGENTTYLLDMIKQLKNQKNKVHTRLNSMKNSNSPQKSNLNTITESLNTSNISQINTKSSNLTTNRNLKTVSKIIPKSQLSKDELRRNALSEIFYFYSKQHNSGKTFDTKKHNEEHLNLSEFSKFCVEFKVMVKMNKLVELFKKTAGNSKQMNFNEFLLILPKLAISVNDEKKQYILSREKLYQMKLDEINEDEKKKNRFIFKDKEMHLKKEENNDNNKEENNENANLENNEEKKEEEINKDNEEKKEDENNNENEEKKEEENNNENEEKKENEIEELKFKKQEKKEKPKKKLYLRKKSPPQKQTSLLLNTKEDLKEKMLKLKEDLINLNNKTQMELIEEFYQYLEIDDESLYRKKMIGFILPFGIHDKLTSRFPQNNNIDKRSKSRERNNKEIQEILLRRHEERELEKKLKEQKEKNILFQKKQKLFNEQNKILSKNISQKNEISYKNLQKNKKELQKDKEDNITWDELKKYDYDHFINVKNERSNDNNNNIELNNSNDFNNEKVNELFKNAEKSGIIDSDDEELFTHLIGNTKKDNVLQLDTNNKIIKNKNNNNNNNNSITSIGNSNIITNKDVIRDFEKKEEERIKEFEKGYNNIQRIKLNSDANVIKKYEKTRQNKKI